jgi:hypothetical protein
MQNDIQNKINTLDRINGWISNCDSKSSILLALLGVFISTIFTTDFIFNSLQKILFQVFSYWKNGIGSYSFLKTLIILSFIISVYCCLKAVLHLLKSLTAKTNSNQTGDSDLCTNSLIHYGSIQEKSFKDFKLSILAETETNKLEDILSQIYINSKRCQEKFDEYNKSLLLIKVGIITFIIFICLLMF